MSAAATMLGGGRRPLHSLGLRAAIGAPPPGVEGYRPLVPKGDLALPVEFNYQIISRQGLPRRDGNPTPGISNAMGASPDTGGGVNPTGDTAILIRNHENREHSGEIPGRVPNPYYPTTIGGCTKLVVRRTKAKKNADDQQLYEHEVLDSFNIIGGTSTNCVGGETPFEKWITCEEVVKRSPNGIKHGYNFGNGEKEAERWPSEKRLARRSERTRTFTKISWTRL